MKPRFEPDNTNDTDGGLAPALVDPEAYDASEQAFAASLEQSAPGRAARFVVEEEVPAETEPAAADVQSHEFGEVAAETAATEVAPPVTEIQPDPESWRREVAARLDKYRARRRPRAPRYPSLQLKFETEAVWNNPAPRFASSEFDSPAFQSPARIGDPLPPTRNAPRMTGNVTPASAPRIRLAEPGEYAVACFPAGNEATAKVIDFASYSAAPRPIEELAEPVFDRPRIIEAPSLVPPPPALGGISIEPVEEPANDRRPGFEIPLQAAPMARRMAAAGIDAALVLTAMAAFTYIFFRITAEAPPPGRWAGTGFLLAGAFWSAYQYLLLVYAGTTPGLRLAKLELQRFDGDPVPRGVRRGRVLASVLSAVSLGLGYAWCMLDEDQLCWHDRITHTYMAPRK